MSRKDPRQKYILAAAQLIREQGEECVSARKIAALLGTSPSAMYRHFQTIEELMVYASICYRYETYAEMDRIADDAGSALEMYVNTEIEFARFAFTRPRLLDGLVFGVYSRHMGSMMETYRRIFPDAADEKRLYTAAVLNGEDFEAGNKRLLELCRADGSLCIPQEEVDMLNGMLVYMFKGFLKTALDEPDQDPETLVRRYIRHFQHLLRRYMPENTNIPTKE